MIFQAESLSYNEIAITQAYSLKWFVFIAT
jgi:hypothetical protein